MTDTSNVPDAFVPPLHLAHLYTLLRIVLFVLGRGSKGKSTLVRWLVHVLMEVGMPVTIGDGDRTNPTLRSFYKEAVHPTEPDDATVMAWTYGQLEKLSASTSRRALMMDYGGGDRALMRIAHEMKFADFMVEDLGIVPCAIHMVGHDADDLAYVRDLESERRFAPHHTALVFNEGLLPDNISFDEVWASIGASDVARAIEDRGGKVLIMPALRPARAIMDGRLTFADAIAGAGETPLGPSARRLTKDWDANMRSELAPLLEWILYSAR